jgi:hypothetical protein
MQTPVVRLNRLALFVAAVVALGGALPQSRAGLCTFEALDSMQDGAAMGHRLNGGFGMFGPITRDIEMAPVATNDTLGTQSFTLHATFTSTVRSAVPVVTRSQLEAVCSACLCGTPDNLSDGLAMLVLRNERPTSVAVCDSLPPLSAPAISDLSIFPAAAALGSVAFNDARGVVEASTPAPPTPTSLQNIRSAELALLQRRKFERESQN